EVVEDRGDPDCEMHWSYSLIPNRGYHSEMLFGFSESYYGYAENVLWSGYLMDYGIPDYGYGYTDPEPGESTSSSSMDTGDVGEPGYSDGGYYDGGYYDGGYYDEGGGGHYGYGYPLWYPIAWEWTEGGYGYDDYTPPGTATHSGGVISWTSSRAMSARTSAWIDPYCGGYGYYGGGYGYYGGYEDYYDGGSDTDDSAATGFVGDEDILCPFVPWGYGYDGEYYDHIEEVEVDVGESTDDGGSTSSSSTDEDDVPISDDHGDTGWWDEDDDEHDDGWRESDLVDVWTVSLTEGDSILITVDTLDDEAGFDPDFTVTGPDTCAVGYSDDAFNCTAGESDWPACPALEFMADADGTHHIIVSSVGSCAADEVSYQIGIDSGSDPSLELVADDVDLYGYTSIIHSVTGNAVVTD
ncbi:MAG: hypothetical protein ACPGTU_14670, partial [Myxococcota bacterium]